MARKDREGPSKRQEFREKRRRVEQRNRLITIGAVILVVLVVAFFVIYPQVKPVATVVPATSVARGATTDRNSAGDPKALVKLTEFSDYQCPYCKRFWSETEQQIEDAYVKTGKVQFTYRSAGNWVSGNAGTGGTESQDAAMAAYCAGDQGKFWQMHDALFSNNRDLEEQGSFAPRRLQEIAQSVGLDMSAYNSCISSGKFQSQVNQDFQDAKTAGITGTPFFLITYTVNGQTKTDTVDGAQPFSAFQQKLDAALKAAGAK